MPTANRRAKERKYKYTTTVGKRICALISEGYSIKKICFNEELKKQNKIPISTPAVVRNWIRDIPEFKIMVEQAYRDRADHVLDTYHDILEKVEDGEMDVKTAEVLLKAQQYLLDKMHPLVMEANQKAAPLQISNEQGGAIQIVLAAPKETTNALRLESKERQEEGRKEKVVDAEVTDA